VFLGHVWEQEALENAKYLFGEELSKMHDDNLTIVRIPLYVGKFLF